MLEGVADKCIFISNKKSWVKSPRMLPLKTLFFPFIIPLSLVKNIVQFRARCLSLGVEKKVTRRILGEGDKKTHLINLVCKGDIYL